MEFFDVVDKNRKSLNYTKERGSQLLEHEYNEGIELWIFNNHKLLLTRRSQNKSHPGEWEVPGGCSQSNETSFDTLKREIQEEIGIKLSNIDVTLLGTKLYKKQFVDIYKSNIVVNIKDIKLQEDEVINVKFVTKKEFLEMNDNEEIVKSVFERYKFIENELEKDW